MSQIKYSEITEALLCGREVEFSYHGKLYTLLHTSQGRSVVCDHEVISEYYQNPLDLIQALTIEGKCLEEIFNNSNEIFDFTIF